MTIKQIEHFLKLYELNNVSLAAKEFDISQSALSNSLKELENSLNGNLFDRIGKNLIINQKGKAFYEQILPVYLNLKNIEIKMRHNGLLNLNLLSSQNIGNYLLPTVLNDLLGKFDMTLSIKNTAKIVDNILNHKCDLGFIESNIHNKNISKLKICEDELIVVCADKNYQNKECYIDEISDKKWILREYGSGTRETFLTKIPNGVNINIALELNSTESIKKCLEKSDFFSVLPRFCVPKTLYQIKVKNIKFTRDLSIIFHTKKQEDSEFISIAAALQNKLAAIYKLNVPSYLLL